jgi:3-oxoadipate enol-lactonase
MAWFIHDGRPLHYLERGQGEPILLVHGLGSSGADWALQVRSLEKKYRVIVPDLPASGHSAPPEGGCSIEGLARALWALCDHLGARTVNLVGFSLGGAVSLEMALQRPQSVRRLGLINSLASYRLDHWRKWLEAGLSLTLIPLLGMRRAARLAARRLFPMPWQSALRERAAAVVGGVPFTSYLSTARALLAWTAIDRLHQIRSKVLVVAAEQDFTPLAEKRELAAALGAHFIVVQGSRHGTPFDAVRATNAVLAAFVEDRPLPAAERCRCDGTAQRICFPGSLAQEHADSLAQAQAGPLAQAQAGRLAEAQAVSSAETAPASTGTPARTFLPV